MGFVYLGLRASLSTPPVGYDDAVAHAVAFFALGLVVYKAFAPGRPLRVGLIALAIFGGAVELAQAWVPTRAPTLSDFVANLIGVAAAGLVAWLATVRSQRSRKE